MRRIKDDYLRLMKDPLRPIVKKKKPRPKPVSRSVRAISTAFESNAGGH